MLSPLSFEKRGVRFLGSIKTADVSLHTIDFDLSQKPVARLCDADELKRVVCVGARAVLDIDRMRYITQIANSGVGWIAVNMVNRVNGPLPVDMKPCESVGVIEPPVNPQLNVAILGFVAGNGPEPCIAAKFNKARENAILGFVVQKGAQSLRCQFEH